MNRRDGPGTSVKWMLSQLSHFVEDRPVLTASFTLALVAAFAIAAAILFIGSEANFFNLAGVALVGSILGASLLSVPAILAGLVLTCFVRSGRLGIGLMCVGALLFAFGVLSNMAVVLLAHGM